MRPSRGVIVGRVASQEDEDLKRSIQGESGQLVVSHLTSRYRRTANQLLNPDREIPVKKFAIGNQWTNVLISILRSLVNLFVFTALEGLCEETFLFLRLIIQVWTWRFVDRLTRPIDSNRVWKCFDPGQRADSFCKCLSWWRVSGYCGPFVVFGNPLT